MPADLPFSFPDLFRILPEIVLIAFGTAIMVLEPVLDDGRKRVLGILALVFVVGLGVASAATAGILRVPVIPALRRE